MDFARPCTRCGNLNSAGPFGFCQECQREEELRRLIAWVLCDAMPPDDEALRQIYADDVTLDSLAAHYDERCQIGGHIYEKFNVAISLEDTATWQTIGDIIRCVTGRTTAAPLSQAELDALDPAARERLYQSL